MILCKIYSSEEGMSAIIIRLYYMGMMTVNGCSLFPLYDEWLRCGKGNQTNMFGQLERIHTYKLNLAKTDNKKQVPLNKCVSVR